MACISMATQHPPTLKVSSPAAQWAKVHIAKETLVAGQATHTRLAGALPGGVVACGDVHCTHLTAPTLKAACKQEE